MGLSLAGRPESNVLSTVVWSGVMVTKCGEALMSACMLGSTTSLQDSVSPSYNYKDGGVNIRKWLWIAEIPRVGSCY